MKYQKVIRIINKPMNNLKKLKKKIAESVPSVYPFGTDKKGKEIVYIGLEDVLIALNQTFGITEFDKWITVDTVGDFHYIEKGERKIQYQDKKIVNWSLGKPLSEQSDSLHSFLYEILCK